MADWYVIANKQEGNIVHVRIVAGPLSRERATTEAELRVKQAPEGMRLAVVEFDAMFGMAR